MYLISLTEIPCWIGQSDRTHITLSLRQPLMCCVRDGGQRSGGRGWEMGAGGYWGSLLSQLNDDDDDDGSEAITIVKHISLFVIFVYLLI